MEKYTRQVEVNLYDGTRDPAEKDVTVTVTNDTVRLNWEEEEYHEVSFWSDRRCKFVKNVYDEPPTDEEIAELVRKVEGAEFAYVD